MAKIEMTAAENGSVSGPGAAQRAAAALRELEERQYPYIGSVADVREEVDDALEAAKEFYQQEPDEVMRLCAGHSARLMEIKVHLERLEDSVPLLKRLRTREVEPTLDMLREQFNIASRLLTARQLDYEMSRGFDA